MTDTVYYGTLDLIGDVIAKSSSNLFESLMDLFIEMLSEIQVPVPIPFTRIEFAFEKCVQTFLRISSFQLNSNVNYKEIEHSSYQLFLLAKVVNSILKMIRKTELPFMESKFNMYFTQDTKSSASKNIFAMSLNHLEQIVISMLMSIPEENWNSDFCNALEMTNNCLRKILNDFIDEKKLVLSFFQNILINGSVTFLFKLILQDFYDKRNVKLIFSEIHETLAQILMLFYSKEVQQQKVNDDDSNEIDLNVFIRGLKTISSNFLIFQTY